MFCLTALKQLYLRCMSSLGLRCLSYRLLALFTALRTTGALLLLCATAVAILRLQNTNAWIWILESPGIETRGHTTPLLRGSLPDTFPLCVGVGIFQLTVQANLSNWLTNVDSCRSTDFQKTRGLVQSIADQQHFWWIALNGEQRPVRRDATAVSIDREFEFYEFFHS